MRLPRHIPLRSSRRLRAFLLFLHALAILVAVILPLPAFVRLLLLALSAISLWRTWPKAPMATMLILREDGFLEWRQQPGLEAESRTITADTVVTRLAVIIYDHPLAELGQERVTVQRTLLLPDCLPPGEFRLLRMWLRGRALSVRYKTLKKLRGGAELSADGDGNGPA